MHEVEFSIVTDIQFVERCEEYGVCFCPDKPDDLNLYLDEGAAIVFLGKCGTLFETKDCAPTIIYDQLL